MYWGGRYNSKQSSILAISKTEAGSNNEIVTLYDATFFARVSSESENALFNLLITAARQWIESYLNKSITPKNITVELWHDGEYPMLLPYGDVNPGDTITVQKRDYPLDTWVDISANPYNSWEIQMNKKFYSRIPAYYMISYTSMMNASAQIQLQTAIKQMVVFLYENRGDQQLYQIGGAREAAKVVPDIIKMSLSGLREASTWLG